MSNKKAADYEEAARQLDKYFSRTFTIPSVRELKAKCGNVGSSSTYQAYKDRWLEDRLAGSGVEAIVMAMKMEREAHASVMNLMNGKLARLLQMFPGVKGYPDEDEGADSVDDDAGLVHKDCDGDDDDTDTADDDEPRAQDHHAFERVRDIAAQSEARFTEKNENSPGSAESVRRPRPNAFGRDNADPIDRAFPSNEHASPSRYSGGGQQVTHTTGTTKPASGEGDTTGGWENSRD